MTMDSSSFIQTNLFTLHTSQVDFKMLLSSILERWEGVGLGLTLYCRGFGVFFSKLEQLGK